MHYPRGHAPAGRDAGARSAACFSSGQGATEYLVLLAVVLVIALVSIALLGFFPGMAADARMAQTEAYWKGASPIAVTETVAKHITSCPCDVAYIRVKNNAAYPIRITKMLGQGASASQVYTMDGGWSSKNMSDYFYLAPGEEKFFVSNHFGFASGITQIQYYLGGTGDSTYTLVGLTTVCGTAPPYGFMTVKNFGFEYTAYIEGQQITKRQIGKDLVVRCIQNFD